LRERERDYDLVFDSYVAFLDTGTGLFQRYGSAEAAFSLFNPAGLASPLVDKIIEVSLQTETREDRDVALMALDRVLRWERFMIPVWYNDSSWVAYYDQYEYPDPLPRYSVGTLDFWWFNAEKAARLKAEGALR
jgi:microcin C transport system substrate-binding protein